MRRFRTNRMCSRIAASAALFVVCAEGVEDGAVRAGGCRRRKAVGFAAEKPYLILDIGEYAAEFTVAACVGDRAVKAGVFFDMPQLISRLQPLFCAADASFQRGQ